MDNIRDWKFFPLKFPKLLECYEGRNGQYPGLEIFPIEIATDGVIDSPSEIQTARLLSDVILRLPRNHQDFT